MEPCHGPVLRTVSSNVLLRCKKKKKKNLVTQALLCFCKTPSHFLSLK